MNPDTKHSSFHSLRGFAALFAIMIGCNGDITVTEVDQCDGVKQRGEETVDDIFDKDGDGYFDGTNPDCQATYGPENLDCDDANKDVNPGNIETECNQLDDDCDESTPDGEDQDNDGFSSCEDCDDNDPALTAGRDIDVDEDGVNACLDCDDQDRANFPGNEEVCDGQDNNCNDEVDELPECESFDDFSGTWIVTPQISYACAFNSVTLSVSALNVTDANPTILFSGLSGSQPGSMSGTIDSSNSFSVSNFISSGGGGCDETYSLTGSFTSDTEFQAEFDATFHDASGAGGCFDCTNQKFTVVGVR
jgi:hypothetical protein